MTFILLARDVAAPAAIRAWVGERLRLGKNSLADEQIQEALACATTMDSQRLSSTSGSEVSEKGEVS